MSDPERKDFGSHVEARTVHFARVSHEVADKYGCRSMETPVAVYCNKEVIAMVDLVDIFDQRGMRFHND